MPPRPDVRAAERDETRRHSECPLQRAPIDARLGPPADASRDTESRLGSLKNGRAYSC